MSCGTQAANPGRKEAASRSLVAVSLATYSGRMLAHQSYRRCFRFCVALALTVCIGGLPLAPVSAPARAQSVGLKAGQTQAQRHYENGDYRPALEGFKRGAEMGLAESQHWLGLLYDRGHGVERDPRAAYLWFSKAAEQGHAEAQRVIGVYLEMGKVVAEDLELAAKFYHRGDA